MAELRGSHDLSHNTGDHLAPYGTRTHSSTSHGSRLHPSERTEKPRGLKGFYMDPHTQVVMLGFVCFMCPGLFNSLNGLALGGLGQLNQATSANANSALYATFSFFAFFAGCVPPSCPPESRR